MLSEVVALLAKVRRLGLQQGGMVGTMGSVAIQAVVAGRRMLPEEGAALLGMAGIASLDHGVLGQELRTGGAMGIVAIRADNLAFLDGMVGITERLGALFLVAGEAHFALVGFFPHLVMLGMDLVAGGTGNVGVGMLAAGPVHPVAALVAVQTGSVPLRDRRRRVLQEVAIDLRPFLQPLRILGVLGAFTVAADAADITAVGGDTMLGFADREHRGTVALVMAAGALGIPFEYDIRRGLLVLRGRCPH